jgi:serine/threonine protein kinase
VELAPLSNQIIEGYNVEAGSLKVSFAGSIKWVVPDQVASIVKRRQVAGFTPSPPPPPAPVAERRLSEPRALCKIGCGRQVQPGLTKGLNPYDTCCKKCAATNGSGEHDENCQQIVQKHAAPQRQLTRVLRVDVKGRLTDWVQSEGSASLATQLRNAQTETGFTGDGLNRAQVTAIIETMSSALSIDKDDLEKDVINKAFSARTSYTKSTVSRAALAQICYDVWKDHYSRWFPNELNISTESFVQKNPRPLTEVFNLGTKLGQGSFGTVFSCTHKISRETRVVKRIRTELSDASVMQEIQTMARLDHPGVIKVYEYFEEADYISQVMEPCHGGELQDRIDAVFRHGTMAPYGEDFMQDVMKQTLRALAFMHSMRFAHKDLKPQNIMMVSKEGSSIKVIDFGLAELVSKSQEAASCRSGTLLYMSPETFAGMSTNKCDIWSAGVVLYNLMCGGMPFCGQWPPPPGRDQAWWERETERIVCSSEQMAPNPNLNKWSMEARGLLNSMLTRDHRVRPDATGCLASSPWFRRIGDTPTLSVGIVQCLECYSRLPELKKDIFLLMAHQSALPAIQELRAIFTYFDESNQGTLSVEDLRDVLSQAGLKPLYVDKVVHALDRDGDGKVHWTEFTAASICVSVCKRTELVDAAFSFFDSNCDGKIDAKDLERVLLQSPEDRPRWSRQLPQLLNGVGNTKGVITQEQFRSYISQNLSILSGAIFSAVT